MALKRNRMTTGLALRAGGGTFVSVPQTSNSPPVHVIPVDNDLDPVTLESTVGWKVTQAALKSKGIRGIPLTMSLPNEAFITRFMRLPKAAENSIRSALKLEFESGTSIPFDAPVIDVFRLPDYLSLDQQFMPLCVVGVAETTVRKAKEIASDLGLVPSTLEISSQSLRRLDLLGGKSKDNCVLVELERHQMATSIFVGGTLSFSRTASIGSSILHEQDASFEAYAKEISNEVDRVLNFFRFSVVEQDIPMDEMVIYSPEADVFEVLTNLQPFTDLALRPVYTPSDDTFAGIAHDPTLIGLGLALRGDARAGY